MHIETGRTYSQVITIVDSMRSATHNINLNVKNITAHAIESIYTETHSHWLHGWVFIVSHRERLTN